MLLIPKGIQSMKTYTIENETNNITVHATAQDAATIGNADRFHNEAGLVNLAADWPTSRLVEIWNRLAGVTPVNKFKDKATAVSRIWKALQVLDSPAVDAVTGESARAATAGELPPETAPPRTPEMPAGDYAETTPVAPQLVHVAAGAIALTNEAAPVTESARGATFDRDECSRLLVTAAAVQSGYREAMAHLEAAIGFNIPRPGDLNATTVEALIEAQHTAKRNRQRASELTPKGPRENKTAKAIEMLKRAEGTTVEEIMAATDWQKHTIRAMLSAGGSLVKLHGLVITTETVDAQKRYFVRR